MVKIFDQEDYWQRMVAGDSEVWGDAITDDPIDPEEAAAWERAFPGRCPTNDEFRIFMMGRGIATDQESYEIMTSRRLLGEESEL